MNNNLNNNEDEIILINANTANSKGEFFPKTPQPIVIDDGFFPCFKKIENFFKLQKK